MKKQVIASLFAVSLAFVSTGVWAEDCKVKTYVSASEELSEHVADLYGFERKPSLGYLTITCVDPVTFGSYQFEDPKVRVSGSTGDVVLEMREFYEGMRIMYTANFPFTHGEVTRFSVVTDLKETDAQLNHQFEQRLFNR
ncbi:hypothetical protein XMA121_001657 [Marinobacterium sp. xm-a-121]|uniref:DUF4426 domain-containing protein n=1 Tax=unclassified Marinobacterium TaxID=2644139 RepID=UPI00156A4758|nr:MULTISPECIES: DUF4426 domain-containing protein [unclassified Marinobacterium]NRP39032.1 hypothetical protein [Marinobacterium sp. xm-a-121]NRQ00571.1 hypothetical protein [Marinobacterium sp. xm-v-233]